MKLTTAAKIGLFTLISLVCLALIITWKSNLLLVGTGFDLVGTFPNVEGLTVGSEVRYRGLNVGKIMKIDPGPKDIKVYAVIKRGLLLPEDSQLRVGFDGLVGMKYLEIKPGVSGVAYQSGKMLQGISTAGLVDFVDIGAQNLVETKQILMTLRKIIDDPRLQQAFKNAVFTADEAATDIKLLAQELRMTNDGIRKVTNDPKFQEAVKGTAIETNKTLSNANNFFESFGKLSLKPSADIQYGTVFNTIRGNIDVVQSPENSLRIGMGEGPTRNLSLLDIELNRLIYPNFGLRLGMINTYLGGGFDYFPTQKIMLSGDLYDFNNPKPNSPKLRATAKYLMFDYGSVFLQADDFINAARNYSLGVSIIQNK